MSDQDYITAPDRLKAIPVQFVTDELRQTVNRAALVAQSRIAAEEALSESQRALGAAVANHDHDSARVAAMDAVADELVLSRWPSPGYDDDVVGEAIRLAGERIDAAWSALPPIPSVAFTLERQAWRSVPQWVGDPTVPVPAPAPGDVVAEQEHDRIVAARAGLLASAQMFRTGGSSVFDKLGLASSLVDQLSELQADSQRVATLIEAANRSRRDSAVAWQLPAGKFATVMNEQIRSLVKYRAETAEVAMATS